MNYCAFSDAAFVLLDLLDYFSECLRGVVHHTLAPSKSMSQHHRQQGIRLPNVSHPVTDLT